MALEVGHKRLTKVHVVRSMHERKALMTNLSDASIAHAGWIRDAGRVFRGAYSVATRSSREALGNPECAGLLHPVADDVRPCGRGAVPKPENWALVLARESALELLG
jgi:hypothetical protein